MKIENLETTRVSQNEFVIDVIHTELKKTIDNVITSEFINIMTIKYLDIDEDEIDIAFNKTQTLELIQFLEKTLNKFPVKNYSIIKKQ